MVVTGYYSSWSVYRSGYGQFTPENIDPSMLSHLVYAFAGLDNNRVKILDREADINRQGYAHFNDLKKRNKYLKTLISIGGWNENPEKYSRMAADPQSRAVFVESVIQFLNDYGFDGLDLDWEYPTFRGGRPQDKANFVSLLKDLRKAFESRYLLTVAVCATADKVDQAYDVQGISQNVDLINVMAYDYSGGWSTRTGHNAPLNSVSYSIDHWIRLGASPRKLVLGIPTYGRTWYLSDLHNNGVGAPVRGVGPPGPYIKQPGLLGYNEFCEEKSKWKVVWDGQSSVPYAVKQDVWLSFDDIQSVGQKALLCRQKGLAGAFVWSIDTDDFRGLSGRPFPLLRAIREHIH